MKNRGKSEAIQQRKHRQREQTRQICEKILTRKQTQKQRVQLLEAIKDRKLAPPQWP